MDSCEKMEGFNLGGGWKLGGDGVTAKNDTEEAAVTKEATELEAEEARMSPTAPYRDLSVGGPAFAMSHTAERPPEGLGDPKTGQLRPCPWNGRGGEEDREGLLPQGGDAGEGGGQMQLEPEGAQQERSSGSSGPVSEGAQKAGLGAGVRPLTQI